MERLESLLEWGGLKKDITCLIVSAAALILSLLGVSPGGADPAWVAIMLCGIPILLEALVGLVTRFDIKADVLVSMALIASVIIGEIFAAGEVAFIMQLGALLEDLTVARARNGIEKLVKLTPRTARVLFTKGEITVPAEKVMAGDVIRVLPGETVPVDGVILSGTTSVNQAVMTGEPIPVDKKPGDSVMSGTVNQLGSFDMKAEKAGEDSSIQRMIRLVQSADADKAKIVGIADRWATWVVVVALCAAAVTWAVTGEIIRAVTILVVFCPCALVLATPTAIMAAIGNGTKHGFLVKEGDALERLAAVSAVVFDKTGTLTYGKPKVVAAESVTPEYTDEEVFAFAAAVEMRSEHPLGKAVSESYLTYSKGSSMKSEDFRMIPGQGVSANVDGKAVLAGNLEMMKKNGIDVPEEAESRILGFLDRGCTAIYVGISGRIAGFLALSDTLRDDAPGAISEINDCGTIPVLMTGDGEKAAAYMAGRLGIKRVYAGCLPEDKLNRIDEYQGTGNQVCMVGDGINDAPALKKAFVGIAMGGVGSDIAVEAADIALINDRICELPHLIRLAKRMMITIKCNLTFSMTLNFVAIILAMTGVLNPVIGALVHNAGSVLVIINSALLLRWKKRK